MINRSAGAGLRVFLTTIFAFSTMLTITWAFPVTVDPAAYSSEYSVSGQAFVAGGRTVDLPAGSHSIFLTHAAGFSFNVDAAGNVSVPNAAAATGNGSTLTFNTTTVTIDPGAYQGKYNLSRVNNSTYVSGSNNFTVIPGLNAYTVNLAHSVGFNFNVDASGNILAPNAAAATGVGSTLTFNTTTITIDSGAYPGEYNLARINEFAYVSGVNNFIVVPGLNTYSIILDHSVGFNFNVDAAGNISLANMAAATPSGSTLTLNTATITIDPGAYPSEFNIGRINNFVWVSGTNNFVVVPGLNTYVVNIDHSVGFNFNVDTVGNISLSNTAAATPSGSTLTFNTATLTIDPDAYQGQYSLDRVNGFSFVNGANTFIVIPGLSHYIVDIEHSVGFRFNIDAAGNVTSQNPVAASTSGSELTFNTSSVTIDPNGYTGLYDLNRVNNFVDVTGVQSFIVLLGLSNYIIDISPGVGGRFSVDANGDPDPATLPLTISGTTYDFLLSAVTLTTVDIDIKPSGGGNEVEPNEPPDPWNPNSKGKVPVAILTGDVFDAADVDVSSVRFGKTGTEAAPVKDELKDVDGDGDDDLLLKFEAQDAGIACNDPLATLTGQTIFGSDIEGTEPIRTVGCE